MANQFFSDNKLLGPTKSYIHMSYLDQYCLFVKVDDEYVLQYFFLTYITKIYIIIF